MVDYIHWPKSLLIPAECRPNLVAFSRSGGRSLGGVEPVTRTDLGHWVIDYKDIPVITVAQRRTWNGIRSKLAGRAGLVIVPAWVRDTAPYASGIYEPEPATTHSDGSTFSDGSSYSQGAITVQCQFVASIGDTQIRLKVLSAATDVVGVMFSYNHALYETGPAISISGNVWTVPITPSIRAEIPANADLNFDNPTCICHLSDDRAMDGGVDAAQIEMRSVSFTEATDYWSELVA